jgi:GNAT superfamily N-acetyltransferase
LYPFPKSPQFNHNNANGGENTSGMDGSKQMGEISIIQYDPYYNQAFKDLNIAWIEEFFAVEEIDLLYLNHPNDKVLDPGGMVFFALMDGVAVGTVAMLWLEDGRYELSKMAVDPSHQGKGIGKKLIDAAIVWAREIHAHTVQLDTNTKLKPAIHLYHKAGFVALPPEELKSEYTRSNLRMVLTLE